MNRKMRAKINNAAARAKKERKPCSKSGEVVDMTPDGTCDECGNALTPLVALVVYDDVGERTLH